MVLLIAVWNYTLKKKLHLHLADAFIQSDLQLLFCMSEVARSVQIIAVVFLTEKKTEKKTEKVIITTI